MTTLQNTAEGTSGSAVASTSIGAPNAFDTSSTSGTGTTITFDNAEFHNGSTSYKFSLAAVASTAYLMWTSSSVPASADGYAVFYVYLTANPTVTTRLASFMNGGALCTGVSLNSAGKLVTTTSAGGVLATTTGTIPLNQWVRIEFECLSMTGATATVNARMYQGESTTAVTNGTLSTTGASVTQASLNGLRVGPTNTTTQTSAWAYWCDSIGYSDTAQIGPWDNGTNASVTGPSYGLTTGCTAGTVSAVQNAAITGPSFGLTIAAPAGSVSNATNVTVTAPALTISDAMPAGLVAATKSISINGPPLTLNTAAPAGTAVGVLNLSGVYIGGTSTTTADAFGTWRGRAVDVLHTFPSRDTWAHIEAPSDATALQGTSYANTKWMASVGMLPNTGGYTLSSGAAGSYDSYWTTLATNLIAAGHGSCWIRFGWEFNLDNTSNKTWSLLPSSNGGTDETSNFVAYWQRIVNAMRAAGFTGKFIWAPSDTTNSSLPDPATAYPGDAYVDAVMPDQYDKWYNHLSTVAGGTTTPQDRWNNLLNGLNAPDGTPRGLNYWSSFAQSHGKIYGFAEWGLWDPNSMSGTVTYGGGGDDPYYIDQVFTHLSGMRSQGVSTLEVYFNADASDGDHKIYPAGAYPFTNAAADYQSKFQTGDVAVDAATPFGLTTGATVGAVSTTAALTGPVFGLATAAPAGGVSISDGATSSPFGLATAMPAGTVIAFSSPDATVTGPVFGLTTAMPKDATSTAATRYTPPMWLLNVPMGPGLLPAIGVCTLVYRQGGVWHNQLEADMDSPVVADCDTDANGTLLFFTRPTVVPRDVVAGLLALEQGSGDWTAASLTVEVT